MEPVAREPDPRRRLALGDLVLVVREDQVHAAAVQIEVRAEQFEPHRRALQVPAGAAGAEGGFPLRFPGLRGLPEHEVVGVFLVVLVGIHPRARLPVGSGRSREPAVAGKTGDPEIDRTRGFVGGALLQQRFDERTMAVMYSGSVARG